MSNLFSKIKNALHIPSIEWTKGELTEFVVMNQGHYAKYSYCVEGVIYQKLEDTPIENDYPDEIVKELIASRLPMQIEVAYDCKNVEDCKANLLGS